MAASGDGRQVQSTGIEVLKMSEPLQKAIHRLAAAFYRADDKPGMRWSDHVDRALAECGLSRADVDYKQLTGKDPK